MTTQSFLRTLCALGVALLAACASSGGPIERIELCGTDCVSKTDAGDRVVKSVGGNWTATWGGQQLFPVYPSPSGSQQRLSWNPAQLFQEVIAFNVDHSEAMPPATCAPSICFAPIPGATFVSIKGTNLSNPNPKSKDFDIGVTGQIVRYDHGHCRVGRSWKAIFEEASNSLRRGFQCAQACLLTLSFTRELEEWQPHFTGQITDIRHGFSFNALYDGDFLGVADIDVSMNPAYEFQVEPSTGLLDVREIQQRLIVVDDSFNIVKPKMKAELDKVPTRIEASIEDQLTFALPPPGLPCNPNDSLKEQQRACFQLATRRGPGGGPSVAHQVLRAALVGLGGDPDAFADEAERGLQTRNFVCAPPPGGGAATCAFRPVFERVNVLPDQLEFVLANTFDLQRIYLYRALERILGNSPAAPAWFPAQLCGEDVVRSDGEVAFLFRGTLALGDPADDCPPCP
jgi:hypothetical protein